MGSGAYPPTPLGPEGVKQKVVPSLLHSETGFQKEDPESRKWDPEFQDGTQNLELGTLCACGVIRGGRATSVDRQVGVVRATPGELIGGAFPLLSYAFQ
jgi:hypothetical protein